MTPLKNKQGGVTLIEVLITMLISAFGLLGMAGLIAKTTASSIDAGSRARAVVFVQDITDRIESNRQGDWATAATKTYGDAVNANCPAGTKAIGQACQWGNFLAGGLDGGNGAFPYRGCLQSIDSGTAVQITVAWGSPTASLAPTDAGACGKGLVTTSDTQRKAISSIVRLPVLSASGLKTVAEAF